MGWSFCFLHHWQDEGLACECTAGLNGWLTDVVFSTRLCRTANSHTAVPNIPCLGHILVARRWSNTQFGRDEQNVFFTHFRQVLTPSTFQ